MLRHTGDFRWHKGAHSLPLSHANELISEDGLISAASAESIAPGALKENIASMSADVRYLHGSRHFCVLDGDEFRAGRGLKEPAGLFRFGAREFRAEKKRLR